MNNKKERFMILDGSSLLYRSFYAIQQLLTAPTGEYTNAIFGFSHMLLKLLEDWQPDYLVIAFDKGKKTFRNDLYQEYKGNRKPTPPELKSQVPLLHELAEAWGIAFRELEGYEADDIIGTLSRKAVENGCEAYVVTGDKDALQLIRPGLKVLYTQKGVSTIKEWDDAAFEEEYGGLSPIQMVDLKALMGDASDNYPGIPGIGGKTGIKLLSAYGSVEEIILHQAELSGKKVKEGVANFSEQALLCKKLARICQEVPVEYDAEAFRIKINGDRLMGFYHKYAIRSIFRPLQHYIDHSGNTVSDLVAEIQPAVQDTKQVEFIELNSTGKTAIDMAANRGDEELDFAMDLFAEVETENTQIISAPLSDDAKKMIKEARSNGEIWISVDVEGKFPFFSPRAAALFSGEGYYIVDGRSSDWQAVVELLQDNAVCKNIHDLKRLLHSGLEVNGKIHDFQLIAYLLNPSTNSYGMADLAQVYLDENATEYQEQEAVKLRKKITDDEWRKLLEKKLKWQAVTLCKVSSLMLDKLHKLHLEKLYWDIELPLVEVLAQMESYGIRINMTRLREQGKVLEHNIGVLEQEIYMMAGEKFNVNSPKQLGEILFEKLMLPAQKKTKTGYSTNAEVLDSLINEHPIIEKILAFRSMTKLKSTYIDSLGDLVNKKTSRIHTSFNQVVTATGRLSSSDPNLQNIPVRTEEGRQIRTLFEPDEGYDCLLSADYSQIELRVLASMSGDKGFIKAFKNGEDIHARTAAEVFNVSIEAVTPRMRRNAKAVNFGIVYGISDFGLAKDLKIQRKEAKDFIEKYFATAPGIKKFLDITIADAKANGFVETLYGRRRELPGLKSSNFNIRGLAERMAMNTPIQGTAADIIKIAMIRVHKAMKEAKLKSRMLLQVHDELVLEVVDGEMEQVKSILKESMEKAAVLNVPLSIDINAGKTWADAK